MPESPPDTDFVPEVVLLCCDRGTDAPYAIPRRAPEAPGMRAELMPCGLKVEVHHLMRLLEEGADRVEILACPEGFCAYLDGEATADARIARARQLMGDIGVPGERLGVRHLSGLTRKVLLEVANECADAVRDLGPSPLKKKAES